MAHDGSMEMVYLPTWMFDLYGKLVGKYTSPVERIASTKRQSGS